MSPYASLYTLEKSTCTASRHKGQEAGVHFCGKELYTAQRYNSSPDLRHDIQTDVRALRYLLQDQAFVSHLQSWRKEEDDVVETPYDESQKPVLDPRDSLTDDTYAKEGIADGAA